jgi:hypothetical protein
MREARGLIKGDKARRENRRQHERIPAWPGAAWKSGAAGRERGTLHRETTPPAGAWRRAGLTQTQGGRLDRPRRCG